MEIDGFEDYLIYPDGRVWSKRSDRFIKEFSYDTGYKYVYMNDKKKKVHRLIAEHYVPNPENKPQVDHINRNRKDNRIENLRWVTHQENQENKGMFKTNTSGHKHIYYEQSRPSKWRFRYKHIFSRSFKTKTDALCYKYIYLLKIKSLT